MKKLLTLILIAFAFYSEAQPIQADPNVIIGEDNTYTDYWEIKAANDTLEINSSGISSPAIKLTDYAGTGGKLIAVDENGTLIRTALDSALSSVGDVDGPASSTDNAITRFDGTTGKIIQNSSVVIDDESANATSVNMGTTDGSDNKFLSITAGGAAQVGRGAFITMAGLEHATTGGLNVFSGTGGLLNISSGSNLFLTAASGSRVSLSQYLSMGNVSPGTATNTIGILNGTIPSSSPANAVQLYAEDVSGSSELKVRDEAGNITVLSDIGTNFVPYTGATTTLNLGSQNFTTTGSVTGGAGSFTTLSASSNAQITGNLGVGISALQPLHVFKSAAAPYLSIERLQTGNYHLWGTSVSSTGIYAVQYGTSATSSADANTTMIGATPFFQIASTGAATFSGSVTGGASSFSTISSTSTAAAADNVTITNTTSGTSARAGLSLIGDGVTGLLSARSDASTFEPGIFQLATSGGDFGINIGNGGTAQYKFSSTFLNLVSGGLQTNAITRISSAGVSTFTQTNTDNTRLDGNTLSITDTNGNLNLASNGTGHIIGNTSGFRSYGSGRFSIGESDVLNTGKFYVKGAIDNLYMHVVDGSNNTEWQVTDQGETNSTGGYDLVYRTSAGSESTIYEKTKTINIGDWNMDATASVNVAHGLGTSFINIRSVQAMIISDDGTSIAPLDGYSAGAILGGAGGTDSTNIVLNRAAGAGFDGVLYDATSFNRGYVTITYTTTCTHTVCP